MSLRLRRTDHTALLHLLTTLNSSPLEPLYSIKKLVHKRRMTEKREAVDAAAIADSPRELIRIRSAAFDWLDLETGIAAAAGRKKGVSTLAISPQKRPSTSANALKYVAVASFRPDDIRKMIARKGRQQQQRQVKSQAAKPLAAPHRPHPRSRLTPPPPLPSVRVSPLRLHPRREHVFSTPPKLTPPPAQPSHVVADFQHYWHQYGQRVWSVSPSAAASRGVRPCRPPPLLASPYPPPPPSPVSPHYIKGAPSLFSQWSYSKPAPAPTLIGQRQCAHCPQLLPTELILKGKRFCNACFRNIPPAYWRRTPNRSRKE